MLVYIFDKRNIWIYKGKVKHSNLVAVWKNTQGNLFKVAQIAKHN